MVVDLASDNVERELMAKTYSQTGAMPPTLMLLNACRPFGEQRIHRAELFAVLYICERFANTAIHTDSQVT